MKHLLLSVLALLFMPSAGFAGLTYKVQSTTNGVNTITITAKVSTEGPHGRMDMMTGDGMLFKDNDVVLSNDGGKTLSVFDPATKGYYELQLDQVIGSGAAMMKSLNVSFDNPQVTVRDAGDGGTVEGLPTHKYVLDASYDMSIGTTGQKMKVGVNTESWTTTALSSDFTSFLQIHGMRIGVPALDKLIDAQSTTIKGFPLKTVSAVHIGQGGNDMVVTTTSEVTNIEKKNLDASLFAMPTGYTKTDDPITKMMKAFK